MLHGICCFFFVMCMTVPSVRVLNGAAGPVINLKKESLTRSDVVLLKDVAELRGGSPDQLRRLSEIALGPAPEFGSAAVLNRHQIVEAVKAAAGPSARVTFTGAAAVQIRIQGRPVEADEVALVLKSHFLETTSWQASEIEIRTVGNLKGIEVPPDEVELHLSSKASIAGRRKILAPIEVVRAGETLCSFWVTAEVVVHASILTASKAIPVEKVITPDDVAETVVEIPDLRAAYARHPKDLVGKVSRRRFSPGDPLTHKAFSDPFLVRDGETVQLRLERNGVVLTSLARAEQDGRLGQVITVRNLEFSSTLKAQVTGRAAVRLQ